MLKETRALAPLVRQSEDFVEIPQDQVPILYIATDAQEYLASRVATAVNLLRCGCPAVQLIWVDIDVRDTLMEIFEEVRLSDEHFEYSEDQTRKYTRMVVVTRKIQEKARTMASH